MVLLVGFFLFCAINSQIECGKCLLVSLTHHRPSKNLTGRKVLRLVSEWECVCGPPVCLSRIKILTPCAITFFVRRNVKSRWLWSESKQKRDSSSCFVRTSIGVRIPDRIELASVFSVVCRAQEIDRCRYHENKPGNGIVFRKMRIESA